MDGCIPEGIFVITRTLELTVASGAQRVGCSYQVTVLLVMNPSG